MANSRIKPTIIIQLLPMTKPKMINIKTKIYAADAAIVLGFIINYPSYRGKEHRLGGGFFPLTGAAVGWMFGVLAVDLSVYLPW